MLLFLVINEVECLIYDMVLADPETHKAFTDLKMQSMPERCPADIKLSWMGWLRMYFLHHRNGDQVYCLIFILELVNHVTI